MEAIRFLLRPKTAVVQDVFTPKALQAQALTIAVIRGRRTFINQLRAVKARLKTDQAHQLALREAMQVVLQTIKEVTL